MNVPYVIEDTGRGERAMDIFSRLLKDRIIFISTDITDQVADVVIAQMLFLKAEDPKKAISIYINSNGGYVSAGLAIYDTMEFMEYQINTYCIGQCCSMAALLVAAGTPGCRHALPNSTIMIHQPSGGIGGSSADIAIQAKEIIKKKAICSKILSQLTGQSLDRIIVDADRDFFMNATEAKEYGLIDKIATRPQKMPATKQVK
jgi:ATP-dependent Clp protease protease subunit